MGSQRVRHDRVTFTFNNTFYPKAFSTNLTTQIFHDQKHYNDKNIIFHWGEKL